MIEQGAKLGSEDIDLWIASEAAIQARYDSEAILSDKDLGYINRFGLEAARNAAISSRVLLRVAWHRQLVPVARPRLGSSIELNWKSLL